MELDWKVEADDIRKVQELSERMAKSFLVKKRERRNVERIEKPSYSRELFWYATVSCLLTTQQRVGPGSPVNRFIKADPFPLSLERCVQVDDLKATVAKTITEFGGLRWANKIGEHVSSNLDWLKRGGWDTIERVVENLDHQQTQKSERAAATIIDDEMRGFGPKQARNLLQMLGLTKFEIPIDSRVIRWLNNNGFPVRLSPLALADRHYYEFILDGIQQFCHACSIYPCMLDAMIFASFDEAEWNADNFIW